jgi:hypothetical protein
MVKVFLGGTCNESKWREELISKIRADYFNPVVDDWTEECMKEERKQREKCDFCLYTITPRMTGVFSIAEAVEDSCKRSGKVLFCVLPKDTGDTLEEIFFTPAQMKSLSQVGHMIVRNGGRYFTSLDAVAVFLNSMA